MSFRGSVAEVAPVFFSFNFDKLWCADLYMKPSAPGFAPEPPGHKKTDGEIVDHLTRISQDFVFKVKPMDPRL